MRSLILLLSIVSTVAAQPASTSVKADKAGEKELMKRLYAESQSIVEAARFYKMEDGQRVNVPLRKEPVFRHVDATRNEQGGGIWMVGEKGRPLAMTVLYTFPGASHWVQSIRSLSTSKNVGAVVKDRGTWTPRAAGLEFKPIPDAPKPPTSKTLRFSQMKQQARRFNGHEFWRNGRHELRLISRELHRYEDATNGIVGGAVFSIAHNTNTEVYLLIEVQEHDGRQDWYYALARFGFAELHINIDENEVWLQPLISGAGSNDPYFLFHLERKTF